MKKIIRNNALYLIGGAVGAAGGYLYYIYVGCQSSGTCPITSSLSMSILWGAVMGGLLFSLFTKKKKVNENNH